MAQIVVPTSTITTDSWTGNVNSSDLHLEIGETIAATDGDDTHIYINNLSAATYTCEVKFASLTDPTVHTGHILRLSTIRQGLSNQTINVSLYQGATLIYNSSITATVSYATSTLTLSEAQASNITDYTDLRVRISHDHDGIASPRVSTVEFEVPDAGGGGGGGTSLNISIYTSGANIIYGSYPLDVFTVKFVPFCDPPFNCYEITVPFNSSFPQKYSINWGGAGYEVGVPYKYTYDVEGEYIAKIYGKINGLNYGNMGLEYGDFDSQNRITTIYSWGGLRIRNANTFKGCSSLISIYDSGGQPDFSFYNEPSFLFQDCPISEANLGHWRFPSNLTSMRGWFTFTSFNNNGSPSISGWNTENITDMLGMFSSATAFNQPIGSWNVGNVTNMESMFQNALSFNQPLSGWNTSNVTNMGFMFTDAAAFNQNIASWNTSKVTTMTYMFAGVTGFNQPIGSWNTSKLTDISHMLNNADAFNQDLSNWTVTGITTATNFMQNANGLSTPNYDRTLSGWAQQSGNLQSGVSIHFGGSKYSIATGQVYRNILIAKGWTITDSGSV